MLHESGAAIWVLLWYYGYIHEMADRQTTLTQKSRIHLMIIVVQLVMKYLDLYRTQKFSTVVTKACQPIPFSASINFRFL